jgi:hypothetical protein
MPGARLLHPQPQDAPCRGGKGRNDWRLVACQEGLSYIELA